MDQRHPLVQVRPLRAASFLVIACQILGSVRECLTPAGSSPEGTTVFTPTIDRPYFDAWLRRTGRQFAISGRLTETAMRLAAEEGGDVEEWRTRLRTLLESGEVPSLDLLTRIDALLAGASNARTDELTQGSLF